MSIAIVKGSNLCQACALVCVPTLNDQGGMIVAIEVNDMCTNCMKLKDTYLREIMYVGSEAHIVKLVEKQSPWHRGIRWQRRWNSWGFPLCLAAACLTFLFLAAWLAMKIGESIILGML